MVDDASALVAIALLTAVTIGTRFAGVWIMSFVAITPRLEAFLKSMAVSVLIAIVVPATAAGGPRTWCAVLAAALTMLASRSPLAAMLAGAAVAAGWRALAS